MSENLLHNIRLAIFDIDGTLTEIKPEIRAVKPRLVTPNHLGEQQPIAGVVEGLADLQARGIQMALATNRGGVAFGYNTLEEAQAIAREAAELCGIPDVKIYICPYHAKARGPETNHQFAKEDDCRKPNPGMLNQALADFGLAPHEAVFVGDKESDQLAAENANIRFLWADEFFQMI
ncbi:MAG: HAD-IIIA family hydrolase [Anaerolineales bacterium]|nr:HAD-IIIA family hydrolase [Anaerolineales bacterium]